MFKFLKKNKDSHEEQAPQVKKVNNTLGKSLANLLLGKKTIDSDILEELEMLLISSDIGINTVDKVLENVKKYAKRKELKDEHSLKQLIEIELSKFLVMENELNIPSGETFVILVVGVNGAGKTTTIGKLAKQLQNSGKSVMLAAGDTFRAAAIEQLQTWGQRNDIPVVAGKIGGDSAATIFDGYQSAKAKNIDVLIADTSGRLHTQSNLMNELSKIYKVLGKAGNAPHETMLVVDGTSGQNAIAQAKAFNESVPLTGITITKLDGTAKGGVVFAISDELNLPIRFIGLGEGIDDLQVFNPQQFSADIFNESIEY
jgi:fused signal recognition particle receptor